MWIGGKPLPIHLLAKALKLRLGEPPFHKGTAIDARRHVPLEIHQVTPVVGTRRMPEVIHARTNHGGERSKRGNVPAQIPTIRRVVAIGTHHHGHGVPPHIRANALLKLGIAGRARLELSGNGVDVGGVGRERDMRAAATRRFDHVLKQVVSALGAFTIDDGFQGIEPLTGLERIGIQGVIGGGQLARHG